MPHLLVDNFLLPVLGPNGPLDRSEWTVSSSAAGGSILERALTMKPDLVVLSDATGSPWAVVDALRGAPDASRPRVLLVLERSLDPERREALAGAGVGILEGPTTPDALAEAIGHVMDVPTRVTVRVPVVFEVKGRTEMDAAVHGRMRDVSTGGFRLESEVRFARDEVLYCFFSLSPQSPVIFASAKVAHGPVPRDDGQSEYGLEFVNIRLEDRRRIAEFVLRHANVLAPVAAMA